MMYQRQPIQSTDTVFLGDSLTEAFDLNGLLNKEGLRNRGMSGDMTMHLIYRLEEITNARPDRIFLMIGINDLFQGSTVQSLVENYENIINEIKTKCPYTSLILQSILPVNEQNLIMDDGLNTKIYKVNNELRALTKRYHLGYIDLHTDFLNNEGQLDLEYTYDGAHLTEKGYELWAEILKDKI